MRSILSVLAVIGTSLFVGCTGPRQWWENGCKVGPNYTRPEAPVRETWIDADDAKVRSETADYSRWWGVFGDPVLDRLVHAACRQNLPLKIAGMRILEARALRGIAAGSLLPQKQQMIGAYSRNKFSDNMYPFGSFPFPFNREYNDWITGFDMAWELDIWGRIRRGVEAAEANLNAQIENYDDVLVILQAEVAAAYIQMRTIEERIELARKNVQIQEDTLAIIEKRFGKGVVSELDVRQARAQLAVTESLIPMLEEAHRKVRNALCLLVGVPPGGLDAELAEPRPIPAPPAEVVVGIPADLLRRRPDVRRAERQAAAQCARIGMAEAQFYPQIAITGTISLQAEQFSELFDWDSIGGRIGPGFRWNILNYGRIWNSVLAEDARFRQAVLAYQNTVLAANKEVEDAIVSFLREQRRAESLEQAVREVDRALEIALHLYEQGVIDYQRVLDSVRALVLQQDALAESQGKVAMNLVAVYKAVGGGWQMRLAPPGEPTPLPSAVPGEPPPAMSEDGHLGALELPPPAVPEPPTEPSSPAAN